MDNVSKTVECIAKKMGKPFSDNIMDELLISYNIKYTAVEIIVLIKCISEKLDVDYRNIIKKMLQEEITYNSIIKIFSNI